MKRYGLIPTVLNNCVLGSRLSEAGAIIYKSFNALLKNTCGVIFWFVLVFCLGCENSRYSKPDVLRDITANELIAAGQIEQTKARTAVLSIYTFQIDSAKLAELQNLICQMSTLPIVYNAPNAFLLNGLKAYAGGKSDWQEIGGVVFKSTPRIVKNTGLYAVEGISEDVMITQISQPTGIIYYSGQNKTAGLGLNAEQIILRVQTSAVIGLRQVCDVEITPVYQDGGAGSAKSAGREFIFAAEQIVCRLRTGQFILFAPAAVRAQQDENKTLGDLICYPQKPQKTVNIYLITCNAIKESN